MFNKKEFLISKKKINQNETWIYSAGFNLEKNSKNLSRIDEEIMDLKNLMDKNCRVFILTHQGDFKKKTSKHLNYLVGILKKKLNKNISYFGGKITQKNLYKLKKRVKPKSIIIVGNTRLLEGEQNNSAKLAKVYSILSDKTIIGGFSKAHRKNASNNSILNFTKGYLSNGIICELNKLKKWQNFSKKRYIIFLGGVKKEKAEIGLVHLAKNFKHVVPSGLILNTILKSLGYKIGASKHFKGKTLSLINGFLKKYKSKLILPETVITLNAISKKRKISPLTKIKKGDIISGYKLSNKLKDLILGSKKDEKILLSGTPSFVQKKVFEPTNSISKHFKIMNKKLLILGGDSANDLKIRNKSIISSGGGAALSYLAFNKLEVVTKLSRTFN